MRPTIAIALCCALMALAVSESIHVACQPLPLPSLPYSYSSLEPILSESAMRVHHLGHHASYTDKLNAALTTLRAKGGHEKELAKLGIDTLLARLDEISDPALRQAIRNNGGGFTNHDLYWRSLAPIVNKTLEDGTLVEEVRQPVEGSNILIAIQRDFGSFDQFQRTFNEMANSVFGSGWVFLYVDGNSKTLKLMSTPNQDNPTVIEKNVHHVLLLTLDLWEHSYYINFQNKRADFIQQWWRIVNWKGVEESYSAYLTYQQVMEEMAQKRKTGVETKKEEL